MVGHYHGHKKTVNIFKSPILLYACCCYMPQAPRHTKADITKTQVDNWHLFEMLYSASDFLCAILYIIKKASCIGDQSLRQYRGSKSS